MENYRCPNSLDHNTGDFDTTRSICKECEAIKKRDKSTITIGLLRFCKVCKKYESTKNYADPKRPKCITTTNISPGTGDISQNNLSEKDNSFSYLYEFIAHVKLEVQQKGVLLWSSFENKYSELVSNPKWNTTNLRRTTTKHKLFGEDIVFHKYNEIYYIMLKNNCQTTVEAWKSIFMNGSSHISKLVSSEYPNQIPQERGEEGVLRCQGFEPSNSALEYCSMMNTLILTTGVTAIQVGELKYYRSIMCKKVIKSNAKCCKYCRAAKKKINQRGKRAEEAVETGSIQGRNSHSSNTIALQEAKIKKLQQSYYAANETILKLQKKIDNLFTENIEAKHEDTTILNKKQSIFLKICECLKQTEGYPFFFQLYENQLDNFLKETPFLHRYTDEVMHFWKHFRHNAGNKAIDILRGVRSQSKQVEYNMYIPSNSTLDKYEDVGSYGAPDPIRSREILNALEEHVKEFKCKDYIIAFDGIIVIPRYKYSDGLGMVIGGSEVLTPEEYILKSKEDLDDELGNEVLQFILQSLDGKVTIKTGHWVKPDKTSGMMFYKSGVCEIIGSCSDGDIATDVLQQVMDSYTRYRYNTPWFHFFDFSHLLKAVRNALLNRVLEPGEHQLHMKVLIELCKKSNDNSLDFIQDSWLNPPDIMKMKPCLEITSKRVEEALRTLPDTDYSSQEQAMGIELAEYLSQIRKLYDCFMDITMSDEDALKHLYGKATHSDTLDNNSLMSYICNWNSSTRKTGKLAPQTSRHITITINNLYKLKEYLNDSGIDYRLRRSVISTLSVELSFCIIRGMQSYVTACEYSTLNGRTEWQQRIICTESDVRHFSLPSDVSQPSKYYNACIIHYTCLPELRKKQRGPNDSYSLEVMKAMRQKLYEQGESTGHKKVRSHCNTSHKKMWFTCDQTGCTHLPFHYPVALESHLVVVHSLSTDEAATKVKVMKCEMLKNIVTKRASERRESAKGSDIQLSALEDGTLCEEETQLELLLQTSHDEMEEPRDSLIARDANGDDIYPVTEELKNYIEELENIFTFMQLELNDGADCSQLEQFEYELSQNKPVLVSLCDCETINLHKFPNGCPCEIAVRVEGMPKETIYCSRFDCFPYFNTGDWSHESIAIHGINPEDVIGQPLIENGIKAFYRLITAEKRCRAIVVAYNAPFDNSRITSCAESMIADFCKYDVVWVDARKLLGDEIICDGEGRMIDRTGKLSEIYHHRLGRIDPVDISKIHGARYDTYMLEQLLLLKYGNWERIREEVIMISNQRKGSGCKCYTGCISCECASSGSAGCSTQCLCFGCKNPINVRPSYPSIVTLDQINDQIMVKLSKHELQILLFQVNESIKGKKLDLISRLKKYLEKKSAEDMTESTNDVSDTSEQHLTRKDILSMKKKEILKELKDRFNKPRSMACTVGQLRYDLLEEVGLLQTGDEALKPARKKRKNQEKKQDELGNKRTRDKNVLDNSQVKVPRNA